MSENSDLDEGYNGGKLPTAIKKLFASECNFVAGADKEEILPPPELPEFAFIGRSNVGKSSLLNALVSRKGLARKSKTPGRTQQLNFFNLNNKLMLVDLPGYGYAKISKVKRGEWNKLSLRYLKGRPNLKRALILIDSRRGVKQIDIDTMKVLDEAAVSYQMVLTKCDKTPAKEVEAIQNAEYKKHPALHPRILATSADKKTGLDELRYYIYSLI